MGPIARIAVAQLALIGSVALQVAAPLSAASTTIRTEVSARAMQPGEVVVLNITSGVPAIRLRVKAFGRDVPVFRVDDRVWEALVGIDIDQRPGRYTATIEASTSDGTLLGSEPLDVERKQFPTRKLRVDPAFVSPPPALADQLKGEAEFLRHELARDTPERLWTTPFVRPVEDPANSAFGTRSIFNGRERSAHSGTDFLSREGTFVRAPNAGLIVGARQLYFTGNTIIIDHGLGVVSMLAHLSRIDVKEGASVTAGQIVGRVGATGRVTGPHLHWALRIAGARVDPLSLLAVLGGTNPTNR